MLFAKTHIDMGQYLKCIITWKKSDHKIHDFACVKEILLTKWMGG